MPFEVLVTANAFRETPGAGRERLLGAGCRITDTPRRGPLPAADLLLALEGKDAVIAATDPYTDLVMAGSPRLKLISRWGVGVDSVDLEAAARRGVVVGYTPGRTMEAVADFAIGLLLALARRIAEGYQVARQGGWAELRGVDARGKTLGIVGLGNIGQAVARRAAGFDMKVLAHDPAPPPAPPPGGEMADLDSLLARADAVLRVMRGEPPRDVANPAVLRSKELRARLTGS